LNSEDIDDVIYYMDLIFLNKLVYVLVIILFLEGPISHSLRQMLRSKTLNAFLFLFKGCISLVLITLRNSSTTIFVYLNMDIKD